jgi:hypothetical protein
MAHSFSPLPTSRNAVSAVSFLIGRFNTNLSYSGQAIRTTNNATNNEFMCTNAKVHKESLTGDLTGGILGGIAFLLVTIFVILWYRRFRDIPPLRRRFFDKETRRPDELPSVYNQAAAMVPDVGKSHCLDIKSVIDLTVLCLKFRSQVHHPMPKTPCRPGRPRLCLSDHVRGLLRRSRIHTRLWPK